MALDTLHTLHFNPSSQLSDFTTFQLGGPCLGVIEAATPDQLMNAVRSCRLDQKPYLLIGGGSNLVISDQGLDCYVIRYCTDEPIITVGDKVLKVSGSTLLDDCAKFAANQGWEGINYASGIPGTIGGAVVGNAGAWGRQIGDVLHSVTLLDSEGQLTQVDPNNLELAYRHSRLKASSEIVVEIEINVSAENSQSLLKERQDILDKRSDKHPNLQTHPCAGSFFRNIEPTSKAGRRQATGWFLEESGGKNLSYGGAQIFEKHANIIVKAPNGSAQDVYELSKLMQASVKDKFGMDLVREVRFVGPFSGELDSGVKRIVW